jgi:glucose-1-phosphate adenylyltransferase
MDQITSVILAGGEGTRLFPLTRHRCKPDVRFAGRYRLIDVPVSNSINSEIRPIFILTQHLAESLQQHILKTYPANRFPLANIHLVSPKDPKNCFRGTADAVRKNIDVIMNTSGQYVLILAGDQLYHMDYRKIVHFAKRENADLVIASLPIEEKDAKRMGLLRIDSNSKVLDFYEKPSERQLLDSFALPGQTGAPAQYLGSMGIYVFKKEALFLLLQGDGDDFGKHIIPNQMKKGNVFAFVYSGYWEDIGTIRAFFDANLILTRPQNWMQKFDQVHQLYTCPSNLSAPLIKQGQITDSLINAGSVIEAQEISRSIVGLKSWVQQGTVLRNSIIIGEETADYAAIIGKNCRIENAIIDSNTTIGDGVELINARQIQTYDSQDLFIRDGIIIVTSGAKIPDRFKMS